ncbi:hypothetical protein TSAR_008079 [Trichomalopsis sarcophagae]|uniref:DDE Tnp4 domain-containing protein n=1 Tax=Trichomalopsis sarcophagae TaxID=543379 RepID=A0A232FP77_9HYME|nr:hypothetical protein TSAR_008079 [Trichomalopsis sarcophagae]
MYTKRYHRFFFSILQQLAVSTAELVFWPDNNTVQETMPACFHPNYTKTRVIIDCTEFKFKSLPVLKTRFIRSYITKKFYCKIISQNNTIWFYFNEVKSGRGKKK